MTRRLIVGQQENLLTLEEAGRSLRVDPKTVARWAKNGEKRPPVYPWIEAIKTPGGHWRVKESVIQSIIDKQEKS